MKTTDRAIDRFVDFLMVAFSLLGVGLLLLSIVRGLDLELLFLAIGSFSWVGLLALTMQPWRR